MGENKKVVFTPETFRMRRDFKLLWLFAVRYQRLIDAQLRLTFTQPDLCKTTSQSSPLQPRKSRREN